MIFTPPYYTLSIAFKILWTNKKLVPECPQRELDLIEGWIWGPTDIYKGPHFSPKGFHFEHEKHISASKALKFVRRVQHYSYVQDDYERSAKHGARFLLNPRIDGSPDLPRTDRGQWLPSLLSQEPRTVTARQKVKDSPKQGLQKVLGSFFDQVKIHFARFNEVQIYHCCRKSFISWKPFQLG